MRIDGNEISKDLLLKLTNQVQSFNKKNIIPHLSVILIGNDPASSKYVDRKEKTGKSIGIKVSVFRKLEGITKNQLTNLVNSLNKDPDVHGIIIQRPVPLPISSEYLNQMVVKAKDVDGFAQNSLFNPPIGEAVLKILEWVYINIAERKNHDLRHLGWWQADLKTPPRWRSIIQDLRHLGWWPRLTRTPPRWRNQKSGLEQFNGFLPWLRKKRILIIGRGETGGKPIAKTFNKKRIKYLVAHSKTKNLEKICLESDIIISGVGKPNIVRRHMVTEKSILIGVGMHQEQNIMAPDYDESEIKDIVAFYTPVPGGVGPVNVACLFDNLLKAASTV